ncbi:MAG: hypothetical protein ACPL3E_00930 [Minisyncoccia bacterium]
MIKNIKILISIIILILILSLIFYLIKFKKTAIAPTAPINNEEKIIIEKYDNLNLNKIKNQNNNETKNPTTSSNFKGPTAEPYIIGPKTPPPNQ